jgi:hypothetical protein
MTDVMKNITKHYQALVSEDLNKLHVPEWNMDIYYRHTSSFADEKKMIAHQSKGEIVEALISSIISKARDKQGKKIFSEAHRDQLMHEADPKVLTRVATQLNNAQLTLSQEDARKESQPTQS